MDYCQTKCFRCDQCAQNMAESGQLRLVFDHGFAGGGAWVLLDTVTAYPGDYMREPYGALVTLPGEHSFFRDILSAVESILRHGLTTEHGSDRIRPCEVSP